MHIFSHPRFIFVATLLVIGGASLINCGGTSSQPAAPATSAPVSATPGQSSSAASNPSEGQQLFVDNCAKCHGLEGLGNGPSAGSLRTAGGMNLTILQNKSDDELFKTISAGKGSDMPPWELVLTPDQRRALIKYIRTLAKN